MPRCEVFSDYIVQCATELQVNALLSPATQYRWVIVDKFNNEHEGDVTTDSNGFFAIQIVDLPAGMLTQYSGEFVLKIFSITDDCKQLSFKCTKYYDEICFQVHPGTREKNNLGCDFDCVTVAASGNLLITSFVGMAAGIVVPEYFGNLTAATAVANYNVPSRALIAFGSFDVKVNVFVQFSLRASNGSLPDRNFSSFLVNSGDKSWKSNILTPGVSMGGYDQLVVKGSFDDVTFKDIAISPFSGVNPGFLASKSPGTSNASNMSNKAAATTNYTWYNNNWIVTGTMIATAKLNSEGGLATVVNKAVVVGGGAMQSLPDSVGVPRDGLRFWTINTGVSILVANISSGTVGRAWCSYFQLTFDNGQGNVTTLAAMVANVLGNVIPLIDNGIIP